MTIKGQIRIATVELELTEDEVLELIRAIHDRNRNLENKLRNAYLQAYADEYERLTDQ